MNTEKLRDEWYTYEEEYEKLNQWIKDTEAEMKSDSEFKATLEEKNIQLERQNVRSKLACAVDIIINSGKQILPHK